jgi:DNA repair exonuclease SbcCD ATPase subunit
MSDDIVDKLVHTLNAEQSLTAHYLERAERAEAEIERLRDELSVADDALKDRDVALDAAIAEREKLLQCIADITTQKCNAEAERDALRALLADVYAALVAGDRVSTALRVRIVAALREATPAA